VQASAGNSSTPLETIDLIRTHPDRRAPTDATSQPAACESIPTTSCGFVRRPYVVAVAHVSRRPDCWKHRPDQSSQHPRSARRPIKRRRARGATTSTPLVSCNAMLGRHRRCTVLGLAPADRAARTRAGGTALATTANCSATSRTIYHRRKTRCEDDQDRPNPENGAQPRRAHPVAHHRGQSKNGVGGRGNADQTLPDRHRMSDIVRVVEADVDRKTQDRITIPSLS
jgi:hypothetical protein